MSRLRYQYRSDDDPARMLKAVRQAGHDAHDETSIDGSVSLVMLDVGDREQMRQVLRSARPRARRRHAVLFEDELTGGA
ncbi:MAG: hypothetical protein H0V23_13430 [Nocardioidaceae bacterium]|nr:hypothetical protein [Nocardioidaceae bacterium]